MYFSFCFIVLYFLFSFCMLILTSKSPSYGTFLWLEVQLGLPEPRLLYLEENGMVLVRSLGKGQISRVKRASIDSLLGGRWCF